MLAGALFEFFHTWAYVGKQHSARFVSYSMVLTSRQAWNLENSYITSPQVSLCNLCSQKWNRCLPTTTVKSVCTILESFLCVDLAVLDSVFRYILTPLPSPPFNWSAESEIFKEYNVCLLFLGITLTSLLHWRYLRCFASHKTFQIVFTQEL